MTNDGKFLLFKNIELLLALTLQTFLVGFLGVGLNLIFQNFEPCNSSFDTFFLKNFKPSSKLG
jgi:hypothetical protein